AYGRLPFSTVIGGRLAPPVVVSVAAIAFTWMVALPIGIYSAVRQYSVGDYVFTFIGFIGLAVPRLLLALVLMYVAVVVFHASVGGFFSPEFVDAPWSLPRLGDLLARLPLARRSLVL